MMKKNDFKQAVDLIERAGKVLVTTHTRPDGDACGCVVAIAEMLKTIGKDAKIILASELPEWYEFLFTEKPAVLDKDFNIQQLKKSSFFQPDLIIIADTNSRKQLDALVDFIENSKAKVNWCVEKMHFNKKKDSIIYNDFFTLSGIPNEIFKFRLGNRSAIEWVIDQYKTSTKERYNIKLNPNDLNNEQFVINLIGKIITVSIKTIDLWDKLPKLI